MTHQDLWRLSATETARLTRAGDITALAATESAIARMHAVNPALNAVVEDLGDEALQRARALDRDRAAGVPPARCMVCR